MWSILTPANQLEREKWKCAEDRSTGSLREELKLSLRSTRSHDVLQCKYEKYQSHEHEWIKQLPFLSWLPVCLTLALTLRQCLLQPHGIHMHEDTYAWCHVLTFVTVLTACYGYKRTHSWIKQNNTTTVSIRYGDRNHHVIHKTLLGIMMHK